MGTSQRVGFAAVAVVIALVAFIVLRDGTDPKTKRADRPAPIATATAEATATETAEATATATPEPTPEVEVVRFQGGKVVGGVAKLRFEKGETARFAVRSDVADEVHVHGYDLMEDVKAGGTVRFAFKADIEGIFEVELEGQKIQLAQLRVDP
jgi:hypothetical protein